MIKLTLTLDQAMLVREALVNMYDNNHENETENVDDQATLLRIIDDIQSQAREKQWA